MSLCKNFSRKCVRIAAFIFLVGTLAVATQAQVVFSPPKNISNSSGNTQAQQIAVDAKGDVNLVWVDTALGNGAIFYSRSSDAGNTFSTPVSISKHAQSTASSPHIAVDSAGNVSLVWTETSPDGSANFIYFSHSTDGGVTFTNPHNISGDAGMATSPQMAVEGGGSVDVVWVDTSLGNSEVFFSRSADGGTSFSTPLNISNDAGDSITPAIAVDPSGNINVAWADSTPGFFYDVFFSRSSDGGATFSPASNVTNSSEFFTARSPELASGANGNIYVLWIRRDPIAVEVVFARSTDGGATFSVTSSLGEEDGFTSFAAMAVDPSGQEIGIAEAGGNSDSPGSAALFAYSANAGASFNDDGGTGHFAQNPFPALEIDAIGRFNIVYVQHPAFFSGNLPPCLCFAQSPDGKQFQGAEVTSYVPSLGAVTALDAGGNVYVTWLQSATAGGNANVFFSRGAVPPFSFIVSPTLAVGGIDSSTGALKLIAPAPSGGAVISLSSSNPSIANVPATVTVPEGASSATFAITTSQVSAQAVASISASYNGTNTASLTVEPLFELFVGGSPTGGNLAQGEVILSEPAPSGGLVVALSSSAPSVASVPASVTVPAGRTFASFNISTTPVSAPTTVQITGTSNGLTQNASLTVRPATVQQLSLSPSTATGGASSTGTVTLTGPAPAGGAVISLSSSDPSATVPASVTVPADSTSASFTITTNPGSSATNVTISASYNGVTRSASLTVQPLILQQVTLSSPAIGGGSIVNGDVRINVAAPAGGVVVSLSSSNPSIASVPASVTIPEGSVSLIQLFTLNTSPVSADTTVTISASLNGVTRTTSITLQPITIAFLVAFDLQSGNSGNFAVVLNGPATSPITVSLTNSNPSVANVPATVTIQQGQSSQNFTITTSPVTVLTQITITASYNGVTLSRTIGLHP